MKEFSAQTGGRYTFIDDIVNLQELALALTNIFADCDNFIVSGCEVSENSIGAGVVYINGKLRRFSGASNISSWPQYIYEYNSTELVSYVTGDSKVGRNIYGCQIASSVPTTLDALTGETPSFIQVTTDGGLTIKEAFFGKYALLLRELGTQTVSGNVNFSNTIEASEIIAKNGVKIVSGGNKSQIKYENGSFVILSQFNDKTYRFEIGSNGGGSLFVGESLIYSFNTEGIKVQQLLSAKESSIGSVYVASEHIFNTTQASDEGSVCLNLLGYKGEKNYYRNTIIGDGKGSAIIIVNGASKNISVNGTLILENTSNMGAILKANVSKTNLNLQKVVTWVDSNSDAMAHIGFNSTENAIFDISNYIADINIAGVSAVNIGPAIKENGVLLSSKYVQTSAYNAAMKDKANADDVYSKADADLRFAALSNGLKQFVNTTNSKEALRNQIEATSIDDVKMTCPTLDNLLADMATDEAQKKKIRENIGAKEEGNYQLELKDTNWLTIQSGLFVRQYGKVVNIQGKFAPLHKEGEIVFTLPEEIDAPTCPSTITFEWDNGAGNSWKGRFPYNERTFITVYSSSSMIENLEIPIHITYIV